MTWYVFLIVLLASLPIIRRFGNSLAILFLPLAWLVLFEATGLGQSSSSVFVSNWVWVATLFFLTNLRYSRWTALRDLSVLGWASLYGLYAAGVGVFALLLPSLGFPVVPTELTVANDLLGVALIGVLPLLIFWAARRRTIRTQEPT